jgi:1-acyl-sn-glycerol-3-phosphate acyltransferase
MILDLLAPLRSILAAFLYPFYLGFISLFFILQNIIFRRSAYDDAVLMTWGQISCWMFGVTIELRGKENLSQKGCIYLFNHSSFFDVFAISAAVPGVRFGAKIELFSIPFFGTAMRRIGALPIDRVRREKVFDVYKKAQDRIAQGDKFALSPEGGRQLEDKIAPFKAGPFVFAINTGADLVPILIRGANPILPKGALIPNFKKWKRTIIVEVLPAVSSREFKIEDRPLLQEKVRALMLARY